MRDLKILKYFEVMLLRWSDGQSVYFNGQTHLKNIAAFAKRFFKCIWPFYDMAK